MNPLLEQMSQNNIISQFEKFKSTFNGNPRDIVQGLLNTGQMTQEQFNILSEQATQLQKMLKK